MKVEIEVGEERLFTVNSMSSACGGNAKEMERKKFHRRG
jgi:hypothetical protein